MTPGILASKIYTKEELCLLEQIPEPCAIVIFGASGDLTYRKLFPSLFYLVEQKLMPKNYYVVGVARAGMDDLAFREKIRAALPSSSREDLQNFIDRCHYLSGDYAAPATFQKLKSSLQELDKKFGISSRRLFYLSTPPSVYQEIKKSIGAAGLDMPRDDAPHEGTTESPKHGWVRVIIEKPFGHSLASSRELNKEIKKILKERQIYRIDHYLGKETVQNI